jgi:hypothetical protein
LFSLSYAKEPQEVREALAYSGRSAVIPFTETVAYLFLAAYFTAAVGVLAWQNWARRLFLFVLVIGIILRALRGVSVAPPFSAFLGSIFGVLTGVIVALVYTPPLASKFKRPNEHPVSQGQETFSEPAAPDDAPRPEFPAADVRSMTNIELIWRDKTNDEVAEAAWSLPTYTEEAAQVIRAEMQRRGLPEPETDTIPITYNDTRCVFVASGLDEANQIIAFLKAAGVASALRGESTTKTHGFTVDGLGRLEVLVSESDEEQARALLTSADRGEFQLREDEDIQS